MKFLICKRKDISKPFIVPLNRGKGNNKLIPKKDSYIRIYGLDGCYEWAKFIGIFKL